MQVRRRLAHVGVAIVAASAGLTVWSGLASAGDTGDKRVFVSQTDGSGHGPGGCNEDGGVGSAPARDSSL
ncbi:MAG: hypothetical protein ACRD2W_25365 [Acidimicrobiales bacterium]